MITSEDVKDTGAGNSSATTFTFDFKVFNASAVKVVHKSAAGVETALTKDVHYTVTLNVNQDTNPGGSIFYPRSGSPALPTGESLTIYSDETETQESDLQVAVTPASLEDRLDYLTRLVQQHSEILARVPKGRVSDTATMDLGTAASRATKFLNFDASGNASLAVVPTLPLTEAAVLAVLTANGIGSIEFPTSAAESTAGVTPTNKRYVWGDIRRYGAALDGATDDTTAVANWLKVGGSLTFPVAGTAKIVGECALYSNTTIRAVRGAIIQTATQNISLFGADSKTNISISGLKFKQTSAGNSAYVGAVRLTSCAYVEISECEVEGMQWAGIYLDSSNYCTVTDNYFHDFLASSAGDKSDICVYRDSSYNVVRNNRCLGGVQADHGVFIQDPTNGTYLPQHNKVEGNTVGTHKSYGIVVYIGGGTGESHNQIVNNTVLDIIGTGIAGASGTGIYCVGARAGGVKVHGNTVRNCCVSTTSTSNGPAGITIADIPTDGIRATVIGNTVENMTQGDGIRLAASSAEVVGNTVRLPAGNNGTGAGGASLLGAGIHITDSFDVVVSGNGVYNAGTGDGIYNALTTGSVDRCVVSGNNVKVVAGNAVRFDRASTYIHTDCQIVGNQLRTASTTGNNAIQVTGSDRMTVVGNSGTANTAEAMKFTACTGMRVAGNSINANGTNGITTAGTCTGSNFDSSNKIPGNVNNGGTGFRIEQVSAVPGAGTYVAGDTVWHVAPAAAASPGAICTAGGSPGTWKAMANIAA